VGTIKTKQKELRVSPRAVSSFPLNIPPYFLAQGVDISKAGLGFVSDKPLLLPKIKAEIEFAPGKKIETELKIMWGQQLAESGKFRYGAALIRLKEKDLGLFDQLVINAHTGKFLENIKDNNVRLKAAHFWQVDFPRYISDLRSMEIESQNLNPDYDGGFLNRFSDLNDNIIRIGAGVTQDLAKPLVKEMKRLFRELAGSWFYRSEIILKGFKKQRGYPGDFEMMNFVYDMRSITQDNIGKYFDRCLLNKAYAEAVRGRKDKMVEILKDFLETAGGKPVNILNIPCGPCREIKELFSGLEQNIGKVNYLCVDFDQEALDFSRKELAAIPGKVKLRFLQEDIFNFIKSPQRYAKRLGKFDLIYSIGIGDYLPDKITQKLLSFCWQFLKPGGSLIFAHKIEEKDPFAPLPPDWFCDWEFIPRNEADIERLITLSGIKGHSLKKEWEKSGLIAFFILKKENQ